MTLFQHTKENKAEIFGTDCSTSVTAIQLFLGRAENLKLAKSYKYLSICSAADKRSIECITKYVHQYKRNTQCVGPCSSGCIQTDVSNGWSDICVSNSVTIFGSGASAFQRRSQSKVKHKGTKTSIFISGD